MRLNTNNWLEALRVLVNREHAKKKGGHIQPPGATVKSCVSWEEHESLHLSLNFECKEFVVGNCQAPRGEATFLIV